MAAPYFERHCKRARQQMIPKRLYVFWEGDSLPAFESACLENMKAWNPSFEVVLLTTQTLRDLPHEYSSLTPQWKSDWARVDAVAETGGVWMDISCILMQPVESWVDMRSTHLQGFNVPFGCDVMENWAFAAPPRCPLVLRWRDELKTAIEIGFGAYNSQNEVPACLKGWLPYLTMHQALHVARLSLPHEPISLRDSTGKNQPFCLATECGLKNGCIIKKLKEASPSIPFVKLTGSMRKRMSTTPLSSTERMLGLRIDTRRSTLQKWTFLLVACVLFVVLVAVVTAGMLRCLPFPVQRDALAT